MSRTPDRFSGVREEEQIQFEDQYGTMPTGPGEFLYSDGFFWLQDQYGVFNPRTGGSGIDETQHHNLDQLVHDVSEDSYDTIIYVDSRITNITTWTSPSMVTKVREEQYTYDSGKVSQAVTIQYNGSGTEVERLTEDYTYSGSKILTITRNRT